VVKTINKERILRALAKADSVRKDAIKSDGEVIRVMATLGLESLASGAFDRELPRVSLDRTSLELDYLEAPHDPIALELLMKRWQSNLDYRSRFAEAVFSLQAKAKVSGLVRGSYVLGGDEFSCWQADERLRLIEEDLDLLRPEVPGIVAQWVDYSVSCGLDFWEYDRHHGRWEKIRPSFVYRLSAACDWALIGESKTYHSSKELDEKGFTAVHRSPQHPDDELDHEVSLTIGIGTSQSSATDSFEFCASVEMPCL
jgi:hypothetical protein